MSRANITSITVMAIGAIMIAETAYFGAGLKPAIGYLFGLGLVVLGFSRLMMNRAGDR